MNLDSHPGYRIEEMTWAELFPHVKANRSDMFGENLIFSSKQAMDESEREAIDRLAKNMNSTFKLNLALFHGDDFAGWSFGWQTDHETYYMTNSAILTAHRRKGLYTALMDQTVARVKAEGFQIILSRHAATNNAVLIPKLKFGFLISSMEISDLFGTLVHLRFYINPTRRKMMDVRSGQARPDAELMKLLKLSE